MKPAPFEYVRADTVPEALAALGGADDARVLAGGQSLVPIMALRLATPEVLVDVSRAPELREHRSDGGVLTVGAGVTDRELELDAGVRAAHPLLVRTLSLIAHPEIRARGTLCGSLAHADPAAELPALLLATDGEVEVAGDAGRRRVPAAEFVTGPFTTALADGEMVVAAHLPLPGPGSGWAVDEIARRPGDYALAGVVCGVELDGAGRCAGARVALFGVAATPVRAHGAERVLDGAVPDDAALDAAAAAAFDGVDVIGDEVHASAGYRRRAGAALVRRALTAAVRAAGEGA
ncbi:FAD binding domain-containing protein [Geodermatophilus sp. YIM 151500]|uniref:FAD binding domain-containing protein n=1 Tax=Geodermatophilus sp. YIM 151500 TaxID=2984531 RepID=UPI0021E398DA|nr:FAD binding domain-containing protein [Geodermatophilus sp. YIM 151500]MCV2488889.1 FAD binding domain-containing protein [Geodermatophilus sp. YIM 151500]